MTSVRRLAAILAADVAGSQGAVAAVGLSTSASGTKGNWLGRTLHFRS